MSLNGQIRSLVRGLHESAIDLDALLYDCKTGKVDVGLSLRYANLPFGYEDDVVVWAIAKYGINKKYLLTTTDGHEIGKIDLTGNNKYHSDEISYGSALRKLQELGGLRLDNESQQVLNCCEGRGGSTPIAAVNLLVSRKLGKNVNVLIGYFLEKGFEKGTFTVESGEITGDIPEEFLREVDRSYEVASSVFGLNRGNNIQNVSIDVKKTGRALVNICIDELFPDGTSVIPPIKDKEKALKILTALSSYVVG